MAMYRCGWCDKWTDDDHHPMSDDELCPDCDMQREEEKLEREAEIKQMHGDWLRDQRKDDRLTEDL